MIIQLKLTLQGSRPAIWRRVMVSEKTSLLQLHDLIQHCLGWFDYHLHLFNIAGMEFVRVEDWEEDGNLYQDDSMAFLGDLIPKYLPLGSHFSYRYDFGDGWDIKILIEKILEDQQGVKTPRILLGSRAAPPEDVGGLWGYAEFLEAMQDANHPEHARYQEWIGRSFDPEDFDIDAANQTLSKYQQRRALERASTWPVGPEYFNLQSIIENDWTDNLPQPLRAATADLPLRCDLVTLVTYLSKNNVVGTKARGNFPRKDIRAIAAGFVNPPRLDVVTGEKVWKLQSEDEVPDLLLYHYLACLAGLIRGGENLPWAVLPQGEEFISLPPEGQVWFLARVWFRDFNWLYEYEEHDIFTSPMLKAQMIELLTSYPVKKYIPIDQVAHDMAAMQCLTLTDEDLMDLKYFLQRVAIRPLGTFGIIQLRYSGQKEDFFSIITGIEVPDLGRQILEGQKDYFKRH